MTSSKISQLAAIMRSQELVGAQKNGQQENSPVFGALLNIPQKTLVKTSIFFLLKLSAITPPKRLNNAPMIFSKA